MAFDMHTLLGGPRPEPEPPTRVVIDVEPLRPDVAPDASINARAEALPRRRYGAEHGRLYLLWSDLVVTPLERRPNGGSFDVRVIVGNERYPVGGHDLCVGVAEMESAREIELALPDFPARAGQA